MHTLLNTKVKRVAMRHLGSKENAIIVGGVHRRFQLLLQCSLIHFCLPVIFYIKVKNQSFWICFNSYVPPSKKNPNILAFKHSTILLFLIQPSKLIICKYTKTDLFWFSQPSYLRFLEHIKMFNPEPLLTS